jgi:hypothetical protein
MNNLEKVIDTWQIMDKYDHKYVSTVRAVIDFITNLQWIHS